MAAYPNLYPPFENCSPYKDLRYYNNLVTIDINELTEKDNIQADLVIFEDFFLKWEELPTEIKGAVKKYFVWSESCASSKIIVVSCLFQTVPNFMKKSSQQYFLNLGGAGEVELIKEYYDLKIEDEDIRRFIRLPAGQLSFGQWLNFHVIEVNEMHRQIEGENLI